MKVLINKLISDVMSKSTADNFFAYEKETKITCYTLQYLKQYKDNTSKTLPWGEKNYDYLITLSKKKKIIKKWVKNKRKLKLRKFICQTLDWAAANFSGQTSQISLIFLHSSLSVLSTDMEFKSILSSFLSIQIFSFIAKQKLLFILAA